MKKDIHIDDLIDLYCFLIEHPNVTGVYNAGFENLSILEIAEMVKEKVTCDIAVTPSNDPRSYRLNSDKLLAAGFSPTKGVADAINELVDKYQNNQLKDEDRFYNIRAMQAGHVVLE